MGSYSRDGNEPSHERRDEPLVAEEEDMVFNTIACANTHLNGGVCIFTSCTSTAGERNLSSMALLQQQASTHGNRQLVSTDGRKVRDKKHHCAQTV